MALATMGPTEPMSHVDTIRLAEAVPCCDCEMISAAARDGRCIVCRSDSTLHIQNEEARA